MTTSLSRGQAIEKWMNEVVDAWQKADGVRDLTITSRMLMILHDLLVRPTKKSADVDATVRARMQRVEAYIDEHLRHPLGPDDLATIAGLSRSQFNRQFRQWSGMSAMRFVKRARIIRARTLLEDDRLAIKEVAAMAGFHDAYQFSKAFRQEDGLSPSEYRESVLDMRRIDK